MERRQRQRTAILRLVATGDLRRAADLAHEHLAEFSPDRSVERAVVRALRASPDPELRRRANQFPPGRGDRPSEQRM